MKIFIKQKIKIIIRKTIKKAYINIKKCLIALLDKKNLKFNIFVLIIRDSYLIYV